METHRTQIELRDPIPAEVDAGSDVAITVLVTCPSGCDLRGSRVSIMAAGEALASDRLVGFEEGTCETGDLAFTAPREVGEQTLSVVVEGRKVSGVIHEEGRLPVAVRTRAHLTSLAAWGMPSPIVIGRPFEVRVGARCSAGCQLGGNPVVVHDEAGSVAASATLGETPWPGTDALYWATIELTAPEREGPASWSVGFAPTESELPHAGATSTFSAAAVAPPEHTVTIRVTDRATGGVIEGVRVLLARYRGVTDAAGLARVAVPTGTFDLLARKPGYEASSSSVHVPGDVTTHLELEPEPVKDEFEEWM